MDFLDPEKQKAHRIRLTVGYVLIGFALLLATTILLYRAYGFGLDRHGRVVQHGLLFLSSQPTGADIYMNGEKYKDTTNARINLRAGQHTFELRRDGYYPWKRAITSEGGSVQRFDYPFLFPNKLTTSATKTYAAQPTFTSQSPDRRWLLTAMPGVAGFDLFDLNDKSPEASSLVIPFEVFSAASTTVGWQEEEWSKDNRHVLLRRSFEKDGLPGSEYILLDRQDPAASVNLSLTLGFTPTVLQLRDGVHDQYYAYDKNNSALFTASLDRPTPQPFLSDVLGFQSEGPNMVLYATTADAPAGRVMVRIRDGNATYTLRQLNSGTDYLLELARFSDAWFVAAGAKEEGKVHVYKDPVAALRKDSEAVLVPVHILKVASPTHVSFSPNKRIIMAENAGSFAVYDAYTNKGYAFQDLGLFDAPQTHASWMDSFHLTWHSGNRIVVYDYDGANRQTLVGANPAVRPYFDRSYRNMYSLSLTAPDGSFDLQRTPLRTPADQ